MVKSYRYIKGCPFNFSLSRLLFNIYLHHWHFTLLRSVRLRSEFFGLYHNTRFMTWNPFLDNIQTVFNEFTQKNFQSPIHLTSFIGSQVYFLDTHIENIDMVVYILMFIMIQLNNYFSYLILLIIHD